MNPFTNCGVFLKFDSHLPKKVSVICFIKSSLKMMKNTFYFILKALFVFKIFNLLVMDEKWVD